MSVNKRVDAAYPGFNGSKENPLFGCKKIVKEDNMVSVYDAVKPALLNALSDWISSKDLSEKLNIRKAQMEDWLKRAVKDGVIAKKNRPVRYRKNRQ